MAAVPKLQHACGSHIETCQKMEEFNEECIELTLGLRTVLKSEEGKEFLNEFIGDQVQWSLGTDNLVLTGADRDHLKETVTDLSVKLNCIETVLVPDRIPFQSISSKIRDIQNDTDLLVEISFENNSVKIEGVKEDVSFAKREISDFLEDTKTLCDKTLSVDGHVAKLVKTYLAQELYRIFSDVTYHLQEDKHGKVSIILSGLEKNINIATKNFQQLLKDMMPGVNTNCDMSFENMCLVAKSFELYPSMSKHLKDFEKTNKCLVSLNPTDQSTAQPKVANESLCIVSKKQVSKHCTVHIKDNKDISDELSDILVCPIMDDIKHKTAVLNRLSTINSAIFTELTDEYTKNPGKEIFTTESNLSDLKCKAVVFAILKKYDKRNATLSINHLENQILSILNKACSLGVSSIAFPVMGSGRAFQYPEHVTASAALRAVKQFLSSPQSKKLANIAFLAPDAVLYKEFQVSLSSLFISKQDNPKDCSTNNMFTISTISSTNFKRVEASLKSLLEKMCCVVETFKQDTIYDWPEPVFHKDIAQKAESVGALVEIHQDETSNMLGYHIKGFPEARMQVLKTVEEKLAIVKELFPRRQMKAIKATRGSVGFLKEVLRSDEEFPSYWSMYNFDYFSGKIDKHTTRRVEVTEQISRAITLLIQNLWDCGKVGHGNDAKSLKHKKVKVVKVERLENLTLFEKYIIARKQMVRRMVAEGNMCTDVGTLKSKVENNLTSFGNVACTDVLDSSMKQELLCHEINEHFLFHGCKAGVTEDILEHGFDPRLASDTGMFGKAVYFAESPTKSDQYSDDRDNRSLPGTKLTLLLARVLLGNPFLCGKKHAGGRDSAKMVRPPCKKCLKDRCGCQKKQFFDSVLGQGWLFREFVVYAPEASYPEYIITYVRE